MIMDFGIAKIEATKLTATGQFVGTPLYMSPEQAMAKPVDGRSDLFSLGSVFYEMLTGRPAFDGESVTSILFRLMSAEPEPPSVVIAGLPKGLDLVFKRCLAKDPGARYPRGMALADDLAAILDGRNVASAALPHFNPAEATVAGPAVVTPSIPQGRTTTVSPTKPAAEGAPVPQSTPRVPNPSRRAMIAGLIAVASLGLWGLRRILYPPVARRITDSVGTEIPDANETPKGGDDARSEDPAQLTVDFEHSLKSGVLQVFVDDVKVVDEPVDGRVTRKIAGIEMRKGRSVEVLEVVPGERIVRVQVLWDDNAKSEKTRLVFRPGARARLKVRLGGLGGLRKDLSLDWS
jgi:hypothetical protein